MSARRTLLGFVAAWLVAAIVAEASDPREAKLEEEVRQLRSELQELRSSVVSLISDSPSEAISDSPSEAAPGRRHLQTSGGGGETAHISWDGTSLNIQSTATGKSTKVAVLGDLNVTGDIYLNGALVKPMSPIPTPSPTVSSAPTLPQPTANYEAWTKNDDGTSTYIIASGRFTKSTDGWGANAETNAATRTISGVSSCASNCNSYNVRFGLVPTDAAADLQFATGAMFAFSSGMNSLTRCTDEAASAGYVDEYVTSHVFGDTAKVVHDISSGDIQFFLNDNLERTCTGILTSELKGNIYIYWNNHYLESVEVDPINPS